MSALPLPQNPKRFDEWKRTLDNEIIRSPCAPLEIPKETLVSRIMRSLKEHDAKHPGKAAIIDGFHQERRFSYKEIYDQSLSVAAYLRSIGFGVGDVATTIFPNCIEFPLILLGIWSAGGCLVGASTAFKQYEVVNQLRDSGSSVIFTSEGHLRSVLNAVMEAPTVKKVICIRSSSAPLPQNVVDFKDLLKFEPLPDCIPVPTNTPAMIFYTSGTTGNRKGVVHSSDSYHYLVENFRSHFLREVYPVLGIHNVDWYTENQILSGGVYHLMSFTQINWFLITGSPMILMESLELNAYLRLIEQFKPRFLFVTPPTLAMLAKGAIEQGTSLKSVELVMTGGAPLTREIGDTFIAQHPSTKYIVQGYGMTEAGTVSLPILLEPGTDGSSGIPAAGYEFKIVVPGSTTPTKRGECGEVCVRGRGLALGYLKNPEATRALFDDQGFLHTGDVGYLDEYGRVYLVDRVKELIKLTYQNHSYQAAPADIEGFLLSYPSIRDVAVIGIPFEAGSELIRAIVVKADPKLTAREVEKMVEDNLAYFKRLTGGVVFVDAIPRNDIGKILRRELREKFGQPIDNQQKEKEAYRANL